MSLIRHPIVQYAFVVKDLEDACQIWNRMFGAGPFITNRHFHGLNHQYRGAPSSDDVSHAQGQAGPAQIQLTQQHNDAPSIWRDMYGPGEQGLHHVMIMVDDFEEEVRRFEEFGCAVAERFDCPLTAEPNPPIARCAYMDARHLIGCFVELFEENPRVRHELDELKRLHETWDGNELIRPSN